MRSEAGLKAILVAVAVMLAACGSTSSSDDTDAQLAERISHSSGARLRARVAESGGATIFLGWTDTKLGVPCRFALAEDGVMRCIPATSKPASDCGGELVMTEPIVIAPPVCDARYPTIGSSPVVDITMGAPRYAVTWSVPPCGAAQVTVYRAGGKPKACGAAPGYETTSAERVDPSELVSAKVELLDRGPRLAAQIAVAEDGAREVLGIFDRSRNATCHAMTVSSGKAVCVTGDLAYVVPGTYFADQACAPGTEVGHGYSKCAAPTALVLRTSSCEEPRLVELGPVVENALVNQRTTANSCGPEPSGTPGWGEKKTFYRAGAPLGHDTFGAVTEAPVRPGRRMTTHVWQSASGEPIALASNGSISSIHDTSLGGACTPVLLGGTLRCAPAPAVIRNQLTLYADAECTDALVTSYAAAEGCPNTVPRPKMVVLHTIPCADELRAIGADYTGPIFTRAASRACLPEVRSPSTLVHRIGEVIDPSRLEEIAIRQE